MTGPDGNELEVARARRSGRCGQARWRRRITEPFLEGGMGMEELPTREATVPVGAIGVEDLQLDLPARRAIAVLCHEHFDALPDHLATEADPGTARQLEAQAARLDERPMEGASRTFVEVGGLEDDDERPGKPGERRQPADRLGTLTSSSTTIAWTVVASTVVAST
jgi:hypothetical protein